MKKIMTNVLTAVIAVLSIVSCKEVQTQKQVQITISPSEVLKDIVPYNSSDIGMYQEEDGSKAQLKLVALIYDKDGNLYHQSEQLVKDYNSDYTFSVLVDGEDYRLLAFSYSVLERGQESFASYSITNTNRLEDLKIQQNYSNSFFSNWSVLGMYDKTLSISDNMQVNLSMATSYVYLRWLNIHAASSNSSSTGSSSIYGSYSASATDYWGEESYSWTISIEEDATRPNGVIVKDLCPAIYSAGLTSDDGYNTYNGYIEDNFLIIESGQKTGATASEMDITIEGLFEYDGETYDSDIMFYIEDGALVSATYFGSWCESGWFSLFEPGLVFNPVGGGQGIDSYEYWMRLNDMLTFNDNGCKYSTTLESGQYITSSTEPMDYEFKNIYELRNFIPGTFNVFMQENVGDESEMYGEQQITLEAGKQYCLEYNCETKELNLVPGEMKTRGNTLADNFINKSFRPLGYSKELKPVSQYPLLRK